jgi:hypothetical protein
MGRQPFRATIRYFRPRSGLRALSLSKKTLDAAGLLVGDSAEFELERA